MSREAALTVVEHGRMSPGDVSALQHSAGVVVVPSPEDNSPFTCIEAMAAGRVVIASDIGGASEFIEHKLSGLIFESASAASLAAAIGEALAMTRDEREEMGQRAIERVREMCDPKAVLGQRQEHVRGIEHWREIKSDPKCAMINTPSMISAACEKLTCALTLSGADFAIGWPRAGDRVIAHGTPSLEGLVIGPREVGSVVLRRSWLDRPEVRAALPADTDPDQAIRVREAWKLLALLVSLGAKGVAVPEARCEATPADGPAVNVDVSGLVRREMVAGEAGLPIGRAVRLAQAFEAQGDTIKSRLMGSARKLLGG